MRRPIKKKITLKCSHCGLEFKKYPSQVKLNVSTVFCGNQCVIDYRKIHWKGKIDRKCIECTKKFKIYKSVLKKCKSAGRFCSKECQYKRNLVIRCIQCDKKFKEYKSNIKRGRRYCSVKCYSLRTNPLEYFFRNISDKNHSTNCWEWVGRKDKNGYGLMWDKKVIKAHRYSWTIHNTIIPADMIICHKCDNPSCVNPKHLYIGTHADNSDDRKNKGRYKDEL